MKVVNLLVSPDFQAREYNAYRIVEQRLAAVKDMLEKGLITEDQADQKRRSLLEEV